MVKIDSWSLPTNNSGAPKFEVTNTSLSTLDSSNEKIHINNFLTNNSIFLDNVTLTNNQIHGTVLDIGTLGGNLASSSPIKKIQFDGKCKMTNSTDAFNIFYSNGVSDFMGSGIRPIICPADADPTFYHFSFSLDSFTRYLKIGNVCGTNITNFTINYTFLK